MVLYPPEKRPLFRPSPCALPGQGRKGYRFADLFTYYVIGVCTGICLAWVGFCPKFCPIFARSAAFLRFSTLFTAVLRCSALIQAADPARSAMDLPPVIDTVYSKIHQ